MIKIKPKASAIKFRLKNLPSILLENGLILSALFGIKVGRPMATGEIKLAESVFGNNIEYNKVRIIKRPYENEKSKTLAFAMRNTIFIPSNWDEKGDVAISVVKHKKTGLTEHDLKRTAHIKSVFLHEMTHVWQPLHQAGQLRDKFRDLIGRDIYKYDIKKVTNFTSLGYEQQAMFIEDYVKFKESFTHIQDCKYDAWGKPMTSEYIDRVKKGTEKSIARRESIIKSVFSLD